MDDLFDNTRDNESKFHALLKEVDSIASRIASEFQFPEYCIGCCKRENKNETVYTLEMRERQRNASAAEISQQEELPKVQDSDEIDDDREVEEVIGGLKIRFSCSRFATICLPKSRSKYSGCVLLRLAPYVVSSVPPPDGAVILDYFKNEYQRDIKGDLILDSERRKTLVDKVLVKHSVYLTLDGDVAQNYLERLIRFKIRTYQSKEPLYGCCHLYVECSDARMCLNKDKMYATACSYRRNLLQNKIFYGKNKNI